MNSFNNSSIHSRNQHIRQPDELEADDQSRSTASTTPFPPEDYYQGLVGSTSDHALFLSDQFNMQGPEDDSTNDQPQGIPPFEGLPQTRARSHSSLHPPSASSFSPAFSAHYNPFGIQGYQNGPPASMNPRPAHPYQVYDRLYPPGIAQSSYSQQLYSAVRRSGSAQPSPFGQAHGHSLTFENGQGAGLGQPYDAMQTGAYPQPMNPQLGYGGTPSGVNAQPAELGQLYGGTRARGHAQQAGLGLPQAALPPASNAQPPNPRQGYGPFQREFGNVQAAIQHLDSVKWRPETAHTADPTFPTNDAEIERHVLAVYNALVNLDNIKDTPHSRQASRFRRQYWSQADVEARAHQVVKTALDLHQHGSRLIEGLDQVGPRAAARQHKFGERMTHVCNLLRRYKTACLDVMEGHKLGQIVNNPDAVGSRKETNAKNNENKRLVYQDGQDARDARKRKRETGAEVEASEEEESQPGGETANPSKKRKIRAPRKTQPARKATKAAQEGAQQQHVDAPARHDSVGTGMPTVQATNARESGTGTADAHPPAALAEALRNRTASTLHRPGPSSFHGIQAQQPSQPASPPAASLAPPQVSEAQEGESRTSVAPGLTPVADPALNAPANMP